MRRPARGFVFASTLAVGGGVAVPLASAATVQQSIRVFAHQTSASGHGNAFSFTERLSQEGHVVGHDAVACKFEPKLKSFHCQAVWLFTNTGDLFGQVTLNKPNSSIVRGQITAGTGQFTGAHGGFVVHSKGPNSTEEFSFRT